jgi:hypothetical protein
MDSDEQMVWASISSRPTHGTARRAPRPSILPVHKGDKEVFWVEKLVNLLPKMSSTVREVVLNPDDSHGQHDVLMIMHDGDSLGVQVTELTSELRRKREATRRSYLTKILDVIQKENLNLGRRVVAKLFFTASDSDLGKLAKPEHVVEAMRRSNVGDLPSTIPPGHCSLMLMSVGASQFYVPHVNDIGVDVNFDAVPRSLAGYKEAIDYLADKKTNSLSPWLLIWSVDFWRDKHWLHSDLLEYMKGVFSESGFVKVYFVETLDAKGFFEANLELHKIK